MRVAVGQAELLVDGLADCADRAVADDSELRAHIHSGHEAVGGRAGFVHALIGEAQAFDLLALEKRRADRRAGPDLDQAGGHQLRADPLVELADGEHQAAVLVEEGRGPGQREGMVLDAEQRSGRAQGSIGDAQSERSAGWRRWGPADTSPARWLTSTAMGISAGLRSGKLARMAWARVTTPLTPAAMSSARS